MAEKSNSEIPQKSANKIPETSSSGEMPEKSVNEMQEKSFSRIQEKSVSGISQKSASKMPGKSYSKIPEITATKMPEKSDIKMPVIEIREKSASKMPGKLVSEIPEKSASKMPGKLVSEIPKKSASKMPGKLVKEIPEKSASKMPGKSYSKIPEKSASKMPEKSDIKMPVIEIREKSASKMPGKLVSEIPEKSASKMPGKSYSKISEKSATKMPEKSDIKMPVTDIREKSASKKPGKTARIMPFSGIPEKSVSEIPETSVSGFPEKSVNVMAEKSVNEMAEKSANEIPGTSVSGIPEKSVNEMAEKSVNEMAEKSVNEMAEKSANEIPETSVSRIPEKSDNEMAEKSVNEMAEKSANEIPETSVSGIPEKSVNEMAEKSVNEMAEKSANEIPETSVSGIPEKSVNESTQTSFSEIPEISVDDMQEQSVSKIQEKSISGIPQKSASKMPGKSVSGFREKKASKIPGKSVSRISKKSASKMPGKSVSEIPDTSTSKMPGKTVRNEMPVSEIPEKSASKMQEKSVGKMPEKLVSGTSQKSASKMPEKSVSEIPEKSVPKMPEKSSSKMPEKSVNKMQEKSVSKIPEKSVSKQDATRRSVTFKIKPSPEQVKDSRTNPTDDVEIALAPDIQSNMTKTVERLSCCNVVVPIAFERAKPNFLVNPKFDSPVLEKQYLLNLNPYVRTLFRFALVYLLIFDLGWALFFWFGPSVLNWDWESYLLIILATLSLLGLWFTKTRTYLVHRHLTSVITSITLCMIGLSFLLLTEDTFSPLGHFAMCLEIVLLIYSAIPTRVWIKPLIAIPYSIAVETLSAFSGIVYSHGTDPLYYNRILIIRILLQISVHLMAYHVLIMRTARMRGTFMKLGHNLLDRRQLEMKKQLKENMINSIMPPSIAEMLLNEHRTKEQEKKAMYMRERRSNREYTNFKSLFRPFHIRIMNNVSILFADIVGFTAMSSKKNAAQLVEILNDLFERFDNLCTFSGCEKISTLGDCYYCVSGCPEPKPDHAHCCVEMGLDMIYAIRYLEAHRHEGIKMRVGVHTGTVLCGIVGTQRVKFDVWSNDVDLADLMQTTGKPELVHITQATLDYLEDFYFVEEGEKVMGQRTYFVMDRKIRKSRRSIRRQSRRVSFPVLDNKNTLLEDEIDIKVPPNSPVGQSSSLPEGKWYASKRMPQSVNSRRASSIKRRSSIEQIYALNQAAMISQRRLSAYPTNPAWSSDHGEEQIQNRSYIETPVPRNPTQPVANLLAESIEQLERQSDIEFARCVRDNDILIEQNFLNPPLHKCSLFFKSEEMEREFRSTAHRFAIENESEGEGPPTISTPRYNTYLDILVGTVVYCCIATSLLILAPHSVTHLNAWLGIFSVFTSIQLLALVFFTRELCRQNGDKKTTKKSCHDEIFEAMSSWYRWHICLAILMAMPVGLVIIHYALLDLHKLEAYEYHYGFLIFVCIVQFCNFTQLNFWMRNILALLAAIGFIVIAYIQMIDHKHESERFMTMNITRLSDEQKNLLNEIAWFEDYHLEFCLDLLFLLFLVWLLNGELEINYRLSFYSNAVAYNDKIRVQRMKKQADMLLLNVMPKHVAEHLKNAAKYSENHRDVAIIFASIVNFDQFYDESFKGGEEHLRVLNEIIGDFDELLKLPEFQSVEKIKTVGSTFMAASGLDPQYRCVKNHHIHALMEFSKTMLLTIDSFNEDLMEFELILRIGFNVGDLAAGVIGTDRLHYDIWGDAVNVASRMNSTGIPGRIQVGKACLPYLNHRYDFESRGEIYVKGKGKMEGFLYKRDKPYSVKDNCGNECGLRHLSNKL